MDGSRGFWYAPDCITCEPRDLYILYAVRSNITGYTDATISYGRSSRTDLTIKHRKLILCTMKMTLYFLNSFCDNWLYQNKLKTFQNTFSFWKKERKYVYLDANEQKDKQILNLHTRLNLELHHKQT
jgi:hypothetical protein